MFKIIVFFMATYNVVCRFYANVCILLTCGKRLCDHIISLRGNVCVHIHCLTPPLIIKVTPPNQESERSYMCVFLGVDVASFFDFLLYFGTVPTV